MASFETMRLPAAADHLAPDGSEVRVLCQTGRASMAHFTLAAGAVSLAVAHHTIDELWFFVAGRGRMWLSKNGKSEIFDVGPGTSISIPAGTAFQFRTDGDEPLQAVAATIPPWPGSHEVYAVEGIWPTG